GRACADQRWPLPPRRRDAAPRRRVPEGVERGAVAGRQLGPQHLLPRGRGAVRLELRGGNEEKMSYADDAAQRRGEARVTPRGRGVTAVRALGAVSLLAVLLAACLQPPPP